MAPEHDESQAWNRTNSVTEVHVKREENHHHHEVRSDAAAAATAALELQLDEALDDMMGGYGGYEERASPATNYLGPWVVTDDSYEDSHDMSDSGGEDNFRPIAKKATRERTVARVAGLSGLVSADERRDKRRRPDRKRGSTTFSKTSKRPKLSTRLRLSKNGKRATIVTSVSASSLSDSTSGERVNITKKRKKKDLVPEASIDEPADTTTTATAAADTTTSTTTTTTETTPTTSDPAAATGQARARAVDEAGGRTTPPGARSLSSDATTRACAEAADDCVVGIQSLPERAEYRCQLCGEEYAMESTHNPWWALVQHECPKCGKLQFPSINIAAPANQITFLALPVSPAGRRVVAPAPAAVSANASTDDDDEESNANFSTANDDDDDLMFLPPKRDLSQLKENKERGRSSSHVPGPSSSLDDAARVVEASATPGGLDDGGATTSVSSEQDDADAIGREREEPFDLMIEALAATELPEDDKSEPGRAEGICGESGWNRRRGNSARASDVDDDDDNSLGAEQAKRMFDLFEHARCCSGSHRSRRHKRLCTCAKYVMLHLRDCAGTLPNGDPCPFDWCGPCHRALAKHLA